MNFLEEIWKRLEDWRDRPVLAKALAEKGAESPAEATGGDLLGLIQAGRAFLRAAGVREGDRVALLAPNGIRWVAMDLAIMAEGAIAVALYPRQAMAELAVILEDSGSSLAACADRALADAIAPRAGAARIALFEEIFAGGAAAPEPPRPLAPAAPVTIIYTSGTSGAPKGVPLTVANVDFMLPCTRARLDQLVGPREEPESVFHYLPCCFAGSWILLLTTLGRNAVITFSTDLQRLTEELQDAQPEYMLNVPILLERMRDGVEKQIAGRGGLAKHLFDAGRDAYFRRLAKRPQALDGPRLALANTTVFPAIRKQLGPSLKALICGSAPLALETQLFFAMLGIPVLQVYGLTETTAICTLDDPVHVAAGRVGPAIPGIEMKLGADREILVRGPNIFPGYWNRAEETAAVLRDGWFHTGDQGEVNENGNWRIIGRLKNLVILSSGHNVPPEPIEDQLLRQVPGAQQAMVVGNDRSYLAAIITGAVNREEAQAAIDQVNGGLPHYERIRAFHIQTQPFTVESGLVAANGKLRRAAIIESLGGEIERLYAASERQPASH
ncbi:MAG TPA: AMP-binding protein [Candidatus Dormibacteraeota bacterium]|nr:AMP-binding protein [Candidatus Dormibacteraeota bacterium]